MKRKIFIVVSSIALFLSLSAQMSTLTAKANTVDNQSSPLGANLHTMAEWSSEYTFADAFLQSGEWLAQRDGAWNTGETLDLDENGWPRSLPDADDWTVQYRYVGTVLFNAIEGHYPAGEYVVTYDGFGRIEYGFDAVKDEAQSAPGRDVLQVSPGATHLGILLKIVETDPFDSGDYIRNIRVWMPGQEGSASRFHPDFLNNISQYRVLRFMDWQKTNWDADGPIRSEDNYKEAWTHPLKDAERNPYLVQADTGSAFTQHAA